MANGQLFRAAALTAASRTLPLGRVVRVCNLRNGLCVVVRVTDRGPYAKGRILDISRSAAHAIQSEKAGVVPVSIEEIRSSRQEAGGRHPPGRRR
jgi:rare lipoprotein A